MFDQNKLYLIEYTNQRGESSTKIISTSPTLFSYFYKNKENPLSLQLVTRKKTKPEQIFVIEIRTGDNCFMGKKLNSGMIDIKKEIDFNVDLIEKMGDKYINSLYSNIQKELDKQGIEYNEYDIMKIDGKVKSPYDIMEIIKEIYELKVKDGLKGKISHNNNNQIFPDLY